jgi:hypothetical protein
LVAFEFLARETARRGEVLAREFLAQDFEFEGRRLPLLAQRRKDAAPTSRR